MKNTYWTHNWWAEKFRWIFYIMYGPINLWPDWADSFIYDLSIFAVNWKDKNK
jgi:hypothetical protein